MKTKSEILSKHTGIDLPELEFKNEVQIIRPSEAIEAMDEYAQQTSMEFAEWKETNKWQRSLRRDIFYWYQEGNVMFDKPSKYATTCELFSKFEAERNQNGG